MSKMIRSFIGEANGYTDNPIKIAVDNATVHANRHLMNLAKTVKIISTTTHTIEHGDYFSYIITIVMDTDTKEATK